MHILVCCRWCAAAGVPPPATDALCKPVQPPPCPQAAQQLVQEQAPCADQAKAFADCMAWSEGDMGACQVGGARMHVTLLLAAAVASLHPRLPETGRAHFNGCTV